jgi:hypothetical protein
MNFREEMVAAIRRGDKTQTRRVANDNPNSPWYRGGCAYKMGRVYAICPGRAKSGIGFMELKKEPTLEKLGAIDEAGVRREGFASTKDFIAYWTNLHGEWDPSIRVWKIVFAPLTWKADS